MKASGQHKKQGARQRKTQLHRVRVPNKKNQDMPRTPSALSLVCRKFAQSTVFPGIAPCAQTFWPHCISVQQISKSQIVHVLNWVCQSKCFLFQGARQSFEAQWRWKRKAKGRTPHEDPSISSYNLDTFNQLELKASRRLDKLTSCVFLGMSSWTLSRWSNIERKLVYKTSRDLVRL